MSASEPVKRITSRENPIFRALHSLAEDKRARRAQRQSLLDGEHLITSALAAGLRIARLVGRASLVDTDRWAHWAGCLPDVEMVILDDALFKAISPVLTPTGILAVIDIPSPEAMSHEFVVLLEDIQEPANLGALLRSAAASGATAAYLSKGCAEAWSPKALRGGQGAQFVMTIYEAADLPGVAASYGGHCHAAVLEASSSLYELDLSGRCAFAFGNEGNGLSMALREACQAFTIPMPGQMESLNVAAAAAICLFERVRQTKRAA